MELLSEKKLLLYLRCYSIFLVFSSFCVIVSIVVQEPNRIISILGWTIHGICGVILLVLLLIKKPRFLYEQYSFVVASVSAFVFLLMGIFARNEYNIALFISLIISLSVGLYSGYSSKIPSSKLINMCRTITVLIAMVLVAFSVSSIIYFLNEFSKANMDYTERIRLIAILVLSDCFYIFNTLFFQMNLYKRMQSMVQSDGAVNSNTNNIV